MMEFVRTTHEPCGIYRCCGEEFEVDPATEENLWYNGERLLPKCPKCDEIDVSSCKPPLWKTIVLFPLWAAFVFFHFTVCTTLTILVHPERKRYKFYEYYAPWGWGERKDHPNKVVSCIATDNEITHLELMDEDDKL